MNELPSSTELMVHMGEKGHCTLGELLPHSFGPKDIFGDNVIAHLLAARSNSLMLQRPKTAQPQAPQALANEALKAANSAYSPYSRCASGVALATASGRVFRGWCLENAAFNPSVSPLQMALIGLATAGVAPADITAAVLAEQAGSISQAPATRNLLEALAPGVALAVVAVVPQPLGSPALRPACSAAETAATLTPDDTTAAASAAAAASASASAAAADVPVGGTAPRPLGGELPAHSACAVNPPAIQLTKRTWDMLGQTSNSFWGKKQRGTLSPADRAGLVGTALHAWGKMPE